MPGAKRIQPSVSDGWIEWVQRLHGAGVVLLGMWHKRLAIRLACSSWHILISIIRKHLVGFFENGGDCRNHWCLEIWVTQNGLVNCAETWGSWFSG
jgi:hypothetical protein